MLAYELVDEIAPRPALFLSDLINEVENLRSERDPCDRRLRFLVCHAHLKGRIDPALLNFIQVKVRKSRKGCQPSKERTCALPKEALEKFASR